MVDNSLRIAPCLTPQRRLLVVAADDSIELDPKLGERILAAFARGSGHGLLWLGARELAQNLHPAFAYWRDFSAKFVTALCTTPDLDEHIVTLPEPPEELEHLSLAAPAMPGAEYLNAEVLRSLWKQIGEAFEEELREANSTVQQFLRTLNPNWNVVGRVHFNLAENRKDEAAPFAFLATYSNRLSAQGKAQHLPLGQALTEYSGARNKAKLLSLLVPVQRAAEQCSWLKSMVEAGELFHPLRFTPQQAYRFLGDVPKLERAGIIVRMPASFRSGRPARPQVSASIGARAPSGLGKDALLDFQMEMTLDGENLSEAEVAEILASTNGLALLRGQWIEVDAARLQKMIDRYHEIERRAEKDGLSFAEAMRLLAGANVKDEELDEELDPDWSHITAGPWLAETLEGLRKPDALAKLDPGHELHATLRPYQQVGVRWLHLLANLGLGACLADDMGLGKTIQILSLLLVLRRAKQHARRPSLLVVPASLLANWALEIERFTPSLKALVIHGSAMTKERLQSLTAKDLTGVDLAITSYGSLLRIPWLTQADWALAVLDEAQAIKNPGAKQTRAVKQLRAQARIALTGTPVENRLSDLWSIFDFINPGLLGSSTEFSNYTKHLPEKHRNPYGPLRELVRPYILRRLKTDKRVIGDLPDKTEVKAYCQLSRKQTVLYQQAVAEFAEQLEQVDGIKRRGLVLAYLMRFKQLCNHPSQWLGDAAWTERDSGKWARLRELSETIAAKQEKVLIFTQFREITAPLASFLASVFGHEGLVLHGGTDVKRRKDLVKRFQEDEFVPFFILSLKAGGSGLNLTAASHVIHFDRWWNPAVENQATDRAFRIGQTKNVLVHKFVCRGTIEEKIDRLIESKQQLSDQLLEGGAELNLTEMKDSELLRLVALDINSASKE